MMHPLVALRAWKLRVLLRAAEDGNAGAQLQLGVLHLQGKIVPRDCRRAARWLSAAAAQGAAEAQSRLSLLYLQGEGVPADIERGIALLRRAAQSG